MKTITLAVVVVILGITQSIAMPLRDAFIRKPGQYSLDDSGSTLAITNSMAGRYAIFARWRSGSVPLSVSSPDYLRAEGWFVFVEQPNRIWVFDGIDDCHLLTASDRTVSVDSLSGGLKEPLPRKVWDALPEAVRTKYRKVEQRVERTGASRFALRQILRHRRLAPVAHPDR